jgi:dihydroxy-acid dehydratase
VPAVVRRLAAQMEAAPSVRPDDQPADGDVRDDEVVRPLDRPIFPSSGLVILRGNLCPDGAVIKQSAATPSLLHHVGRAVVFRDRQDVTDRIDDPALDVDESSVIILQRAGPRGGPGMPEWGRIPIPRKLAERGVTDMVRISDGRMSGTGYGTCVVHVSPESAVGGPLALVRDGDLVELDVPNRRLDVRLSPDELAARRAAWTADPPRFERGYGRLYLEHVLQAPQGADFDFLEGGPGQDLAPYVPAGF